MPNEAANKSRVLERKMSKNRRILRMILLFLPIPLALLATASLVFAVQAITAPLEIEQVVATQVLEQEVSFDYSAIPRISTLYPTREPLGRQKTYLVNLLDQFTVHIRGRVKAPYGVQVEGSHQVVMRVEADNLWSKDYVLNPETSFSGADEFMALDLPLVLPLRELLDFGAEVAKEAQTGSSAYKITLLPYLKAQTVGESPALANEFGPSFAFELSNLILIPRGVPQERYYEEYDSTQDLVQSHAVSQPVTELQPNAFLGLPIPAARVLFVCLTLLSSYLALWLLVRNSKNRVRLSEAEIIQKRYGTRIIEVQAGSLPVGKQRLQLGNFQALLALADEREKSILYTNHVDGVASSHTYYLIDGDLVYTYIIPRSSEVPC